MRLQIKLFSRINLVIIFTAMVSQSRVYRESQVDECSLSSSLRGERDSKKESERERERERERKREREREREYE